MALSKKKRMGSADTAFGIMAIKVAMGVVCRARYAVDHYEGGFFVGKKRSSTRKVNSKMLPIQRCFPGWAMSSVKIATLAAVK